MQRAQVICGICIAVIRYLWVVKEYEDKGFSVVTLSGQGLHGFNKYIPFT